MNIDQTADAVVAQIIKTVYIKGTYSRYLLPLYTYTVQVPPIVLCTGVGTEAAVQTYFMGNNRLLATKEWVSWWWVIESLYLISSRNKTSNNKR